MGLFKVLGAIALAPVALAAAPVVGVAGVAATAVSTIGAASVTKSTVDYAAEKFNDYKDNIRQEGYEHGFRAGEVESKKKFMEMLKEDDNLRLGVFALSLYVAKLDGLDDSEISFIETQIGRPDGIANDRLRERFKAIYNEDMSFPEIDKKFLSGYPEKVIKELDGVIDAVIKSDNIISDKEQEFWDYVWKPYLNKRLQ